MEEKAIRPFQGFSRTLSGRETHNSSVSHPMTDIVSRLTKRNPEKDIILEEKIDVEQDISNFTLAKLNSLPKNILYKSNLLDLNKFSIIKTNREARLSVTNEPEVIHIINPTTIYIIQAQ